MMMGDRKLMIAYWHNFMEFFFVLLFYLCWCLSNHPTSHKVEHHIVVKKWRRILFRKHFHLVFSCECSLVTSCLMTDKKIREKSIPRKKKKEDFDRSLNVLSVWILMIILINIIYILDTRNVLIYWKFILPFSQPLTVKL